MGLLYNREKEKEREGRGRCILCIPFNVKKTRLLTSQITKMIYLLILLSLPLNSQWEIIYKNERGFDRSSLKYPDLNYYIGKLDMLIVSILLSGDYDH